MNTHFHLKLILCWFAGVALVQAQTSNVITGATPVVTSSLILHLQFDDGSGDIAADSSGFANNAQLKNVLEWGSNTFSGALHFDGVKDYAKVPDAVSLETITGPFSIAAWVWRDVNQNDWNMLLSRQSGTSPTQSYSLGFSTNAYAFAVTTTDGSASITYANAPVGQWTQIVGTYDGSQLRLYVDGSLVGSTPQTGSFAADTTPVMIGAAQQQPTEILDHHFQGWIDDLRLYSSALSAAEILALAHPNNQSPIANAGSDKSTTVGNAVILDGSASSDPDNGPHALTYSWSQVNGPATLTLNNATQAATTITPAQAGTYVLRLTVSDGLASASDLVTLTVSAAADTTAPATPTGLVVTTVSTSQLNLSWNASTDAGGSGLAGYKVYRAGTLIATVTTTSYSDTGRTAGTQYCYTVLAYDNAGNQSTATASTCGTTTANPPSTPSNLTTTATSSTAIKLQWKDNSSNELGFIIERASSASGPWTQIKSAAAGTTTYQDTGLNPLTTYFYRVSAFN